MEKTNVTFPSEPPAPGHRGRSGSITGQQQGNSRLTVKAAKYSHPDSAICLEDSPARQSQQPSYKPPTLDPYRFPPRKALPKPIRVGSKLYTLVRELQPPTDEKGAMSDGLRVLKDSNGTLVVEKRLRMTDKHDKERAEAEVKALEQIKSVGGSPHINHLIEAFYTEGDSHSSLVLEYCDGGSLRDIISKSRKSGELMLETFCWHVFLQLSSALAMSHHGVLDPFRPENRPQKWNTICHIDIKPANIFLHNKKVRGFENSPFPTVVLGDFGCSVTKKDLLKGDEISLDQVPFGTKGWFPPEALDSSISKAKVAFHGRQTDIWQLGGIILAMCHKAESPDMALMAYDRPCGSGYSADLSQAVQKCMAMEPSNRPTAIDVARGVKGMMGQHR